MVTDAVRGLLERGSRVLGLRLCLHDNPMCFGLPLTWREHHSPPCLAIKRTRQSDCAAFCGGVVHQRLRTSACGSIHTCPFGYTDLAWGIRAGGLLQGVLFAGPCWSSRAAPPHPDLVRAPNRRWLEDRLALLGALAGALGQRYEAILATSDADFACCMKGGDGAPAQAPADRRARILAFLQATDDGLPRIEDLAKTLHLSPSRTGHVVREIFGCTYADLLHGVRLEEGARLLRVTDWAVGRIALALGYHDQSHFTRRFRARYDASPLAYRRQHRHGV